MSIFESKKPVWPMDVDAPRDIEDRDGVNPDICQHGWHRNTCGKCKPVTLKNKKINVQEVR